MKKNNKTLEALSNLFLCEISRSNRRPSIKLSGCSPFTSGDNHWLNGAISTTRLRGTPSILVNSFDNTLSKGYKKIMPILLDKGILYLNKIKSKSFPEDLSNYDTEYLNFLKQSYTDINKVAREKGVYWTFGRTQKYFNILNKYLIAVFFSSQNLNNYSRKDIESISKYFKFFHIPIDNGIIRHSSRNGLELTDIYWGYNLTEKNYKSIQNLFRNQSKVLKLECAMHYEMNIWLPKENCNN
jgi:NADPH-dependent 7-cyano-7-deazaguanine reductase QueF-like protein